MKTQFLHQTGGTLAYDDSGGPGPLVLMIPGLGDIRQEYRFVVPELIAAGYRVVTLDLRGHGESSVGWPDYSIASVGRDILALIEHLEAGPATVIATSFSPGAAVWAATEKPEAIKALVLIGAFVRDHKMNSLQKLMFNLLLNGPWKVRAWDMFYRSLYPTRQPGDLATYRRQLRANLSEPGRFQAVKAMATVSKADAETRLSAVQAPALVLMGSKDPDFNDPDPEAEARFIAGQLSGQVVMIEGAGHYPHAEMPEQVVPVLIDFLSKVRGQNGA